MITVRLAVGMVAAYLLVGLVLYRHTFKEALPDRFDRALLVFAPVLYVRKRLAERPDLRNDQPGNPRNG